MCPQSAPLVFSTHLPPGMRILPTQLSLSTLGLICAVQVAVDLFVMSQAHVDLATLGSISRITAGQLYHYHPFHASIHAPLLLNDLRWNVSRPQASWPLALCSPSPPCDNAP